jgi:predicted deacylase
VLEIRPARNRNASKADALSFLSPQGQQWLPKEKLRSYSSLMKNTIVFFMSVFFLTSTLNAGQAKAEKLELFKIPHVSKATLDIVAERFEILSKDQDGFEVFVPNSKVSEFLGLVPTAIQLKNGWQDLDVFPKGYKDLSKVELQLKDFAAKYSEIAKLSVLGKTASGHDILVLKVSDNPAFDENEPELMITAATHGNEINSTEVLLRLMDELLQGYTSNKRLRQMVADNEIFFVPVVNADGYSKIERYENGIDPNRNFPWPEKPEVTPLGSTKAMIEFFHSRKIAGSIDYHSSGKLIMHPWAYTEQSVEGGDLAKFTSLTSQMAETNKYTFGSIAEVIYVAKGSSADYYYWKNRSISLGIEIGSRAQGQQPSIEAIPGQVNENREALWRFIEYF